LRFVWRLSFRAVPEFDIRAADVGAVSRKRADDVGEDDDLFGAPELVIEVKSPWNTKKELRERAALCITHGSLEFWVVDDKRQTITILSREGISTVYRPGDSVPLTAFGSDSISVDDIFA